MKRITFLKSLIAIPLLFEIMENPKKLIEKDAVNKGTFYGDILEYGVEYKGMIFHHGILTGMR